MCRVGPRPRSLLGCVIVRLCAGFGPLSPYVPALGGDTHGQLSKRGRNLEPFVGWEPQAHTPSVRGHARAYLQVGPGPSCSGPNRLRIPEIARSRRTRWNCPSLRQRPMTPWHVRWPLDPGASKSQGGGLPTSTWHCLTAQARPARSRHLRYILIN